MYAFIYQGGVRDGGGGGVGGTGDEATAVHFFRYSRTCLQRPPEGLPQSGLYGQVVTWFHLGGRNGQVVVLKMWPLGQVRRTVSATYSIYIRLPCRDPFTIFALAIQEYVSWQELDCCNSQTHTNDRQRNLEMNKRLIPRSLARTSPCRPSVRNRRSFPCVTS